MLGGSTTKVPEKWDGEADVVAVGGGNAGILAAITANDKEVEVILSEVSTGMVSSLFYFVHKVTCNE